MRAIYKRFSVIAGFGILLAILVADALVIHRQFTVQVANHEWVAHTSQVRLQLAQTQSLLADAETGQRGYLLTSNPQYLAPYNQAVTQVDDQIKQLAELTADNPSQQARIPQLRTLAKQKLSELAATIQLYNSGDVKGASALVLTDSGKRTMDGIRALLDDMEREETSLKATRVLAYERSVRLTVACIYLTSLLAALGLVFLAHFILREMKMREKHAAEIRQREEWFRVTLTSIGDGVIATDARRLVTFVNSIAERLTGWKMAEAQGKPISTVFPIYSELTRQPVENPVSKVMELGRIIGLANHTILVCTDGTTIPIEDSAAPIRDNQGTLVGVVLVFRDATAERRSQELLRKTEKIAAAARLAATVAHEINNPLEAVGNLIYLAKARPGVPASAIADLNLAEDELARASHVTRQTLGFYRESTFPDTLEIPALVESVLKLYANKLAGKNISVEREFGECPSLQGWAGELKQVVANLVSNAIDAMQAGGTLRVSVAGAKSDDGEIVELTVTDTGTGIGHDDLERIFEPFFTTKKEVGTGLGLWVSKQIVERHGGKIRVHSRNGSAGGGTTFTVALPCVGRRQFGTATTA